MTAALEGGERSAARPSRTLPPGKTRYPLYRRLGGPQGRSGRAENLVPTGIRSRTEKPVVSRYTDWATWPTYSDHLLLTKHQRSETVFVRVHDVLFLVCVCVCVCALYKCAGVMVNNPLVIWNAEFNCSKDIFQFDVPWWITDIKYIHILAIKKYTSI
jgi:hypothetical protein